MAKAVSGTELLALLQLCNAFAERMPIVAVSPHAGGGNAPWTLGSLTDGPATAFVGTCTSESEIAIMIAKAANMAGPMAAELLARRYDVL